MWILLIKLGTVLVCSVRMEVIQNGFSKSNSTSFIMPLKFEPVSSFDQNFQFKDKIESKILGVVKDNHGRIRRRSSMSQKTKTLRHVQNSKKTRRKPVFLWPPIYKNIQNNNNTSISKNEDSSKNEMNLEKENKILSIIRLIEPIGTDHSNNLNAPDINSINLPEIYIHEDKSVGNRIQGNRIKFEASETPFVRPRDSKTIRPITPPTELVNLAHLLNFSDHTKCYPELNQSIFCHCPSGVREIPSQWVDWFKYDLKLVCRTNEHWLQFNPPGPILTHLVFGSLYFIIMIVGCIGNALVIFAFAR